MLFLKLVLAPALVAAASLAERRYGHRVAGWTAGFPIVGGPILLLLGLEQGLGFASAAAHQTVLGLVSLAAFALTYGWVSRRLPAAPALAVAYAVFAMGTAAMSKVALGLPMALAVAIGCLVTARLLLPTPSGEAVQSGPPSLVLRMLATAALVLTLTGLAHALGPRVSGLLVPFPVASSVLIVAAHRSGGHTAVLRLLRGFVPALYGFALFCAVVSYALPEHGILAAFTAGIAASLVSQWAVLKLG
jgi:hypothetical protein